MIELNVYQNIKNPNVSDTISLNSWLEQIKNPDKKYLSLIEEARIIGKGNERYDYIKTCELPAITYNFTFNGRKLNKNIISSTGIIFIDIDEDIDITKLDLSKIYVIYKSLNGKGYHILVKCNNVTDKNFKDYYYNILNDLNLIQYFDINAVKKTQYTVLSFDKDMIVNDNSFIYEYNNIKEINKKTVHSHTNRKEERYIVRDDTDFEKKEYITIRTSNIDEIRENSGLSDSEISFITDFEEGWKYIECTLPSLSKCTEGKRNSSLLSFFNNLVILNPQVDDKLLLKRLLDVNQLLLSPLSDSQIYSISKSIFRYRDEGTLKPIYRKKNRKIVFSKDCGFSKEEKLEIVGQLVNENKVEKSKEKLAAIINTWNIITDGKISQNKVSQMYGMSKTTVNKYWTEFSDKVKEINDNFKEYKKINK